ncbi:MAG: carbohydrate ABC transporter substrate-binding protein [Spirochaetaceae bacterium]|nr:carbohydrate ABC transporter substrate-binding protein [Spirochaetaceae bacterium]
MKKFLVTLFSLFLCVSVFAQMSNETIAVWSFTYELAQMVEYYKADKPGVKIDYSLTPTDYFPKKLDSVLASGIGAPDVFALEDAFVRKYIESGLLLDLTDVYNEVKDKIMSYPVEVGSYEGKVYGMSLQTAPGAYFYRRSLAQKYLGTDDPAEVQKYFENWDTFLSTAAMLKEKSDGNCYIVTGTGDLYKPFKASRKAPWVVDGKLYVDPELITYMELSKIFRDKGYDARLGQWSESWYRGMYGELRDEWGNAKEVFGYFLPTWGFRYVLKTSAPDTAGDWGMIEGPSAWRWGGTWVAAYKDTKKTEAAKDLIKYITTDDNFLETWANNTGDVVSNLNVVNKIKDTYTDAFLNGQNHYAMFAEIAKKVNGKLEQETDRDIDSIFFEEYVAYVMGEKSIDKAITDFKAKVKAELGLSSYKKKRVAPAKQVQPS